MKKKGKGEYPIKLIEFNEFDHEIDSTGKPVLMLCIRWAGTWRGGLS
jgi:hypothetical protein